MTKTCNIIINGNQKIKVIYFEKPKYSGEIGASAIRANVTISAYPVTNATTKVMKDNITKSLKNNGWGVSSVSISVSPSSGLWYIAIVVNAVQNTADELERIKQGVGYVVKTFFSSLNSLEAGFAGSAASSPTSNNGSAKTYTIAGTLGDNLGYLSRTVSVATIRTEVLRQFAALGWNIQTFDFDWYSDEQQYRFRLTALVNGSYSLSDVKSGATKAFQEFNAGTIFGYSTGTFFTNVRLDAADQYVAPSASNNTNNSANTNSLFQLPGLPGNSFLGGLGQGLGLSSPYALVAGAFILILILKR